jgi:GT2 family glycosyltransferase
MVPSVTVIIPTYNRRPHLLAAIESVLRQTYTDWELIVVDDGSQDGTLDAIQPYLADRRFQYVSQPHVGRSAARNYGAHLARGEWLAFLDSDDLYLPGALAAHLVVCGESPDLAMTLGGYEYINDDGRRLGERRPWDESGLALADWLFNCLGVPGSVMIRRDWFQRAQGFDSSLHMAEDWDLFLRLAQAGCPMGWTRAAVCQYRQHPGASIRALALHRDSSLRALEKAFSRPDLPPHLASLASQAKAWVYVVFACKAISAGDVPAAALDLQQALALDPGLSDSRRLRLLESLYGVESLEPAAGSAEVTQMDAAVTASLPPALRQHSRAIRRARARAHMTRFFRASGYAAHPLAMSELRAALRLDPSWLLNRGVVAFCLRQIWRGSPLAAGQGHG